MANGTTPSNIGTQGSREKFQWPKQSDELEHFITFTPSRYSRSKREDPGKRTRDAVITLPIPYTLSAAYGMQWAGKDVGALGSTLAKDEAFQKVVAGVIGGQDIGALKGVVDMNFKKLIEVAKTTGIKNVVAGVGSQLGVDLMTAVSTGSGITHNPHKAMMFEGMEFRTHNFNYKFLAKSFDESKEIQKIIEAFKEYSHPDLFNNKQIFDYPYEWAIKFSGGVKNFLYAFTPCVLTSLSTSYNGAGQPYFFESDGFGNPPVQIELTMAFKELEILTRKKLKKEYMGDPGFGHKMG